MDNGTQVHPKKTVQIGGMPVELSPPKRLAVCLEVWQFAAVNEFRAGAAALGVCWQSTQRPRTDLRRCQFNIGAYGERVFSELLDRGLPWNELQVAGIHALNLIATTIPAVAKAGEEEDFFDRSAPSGIEPSSASSESGASAPGGSPP